MEKKVFGASDGVSVEVSSALRLIAKGAGLTFAGLAFSKVVSYLFRLIVSRIGPDDYGLFSIGIAVFDIVATIAMLGISWGVLRYVPEYAAKKDAKRLDEVINASLFVTLTAGVLAGIVLFLLAGSLAQGIFHDARVAPVIALLALAIPFYNAGGVALAACRSFKRIWYEVLTKYFIENGLKLLLAAAVVLIGAGFLRVTAAFAAAIVFSSLFAFLLLKRAWAGFRLPYLPSRPELALLLAYSLPLMLSNAVWLFVVWSDTLLLGVLRTVAEVGVYNAALPTAALLQLAPVALEIAFKPVTIELIKLGKLNDFRRVYSSLTKWIFLVNAPVLAFFWVFHGQVMRVLFGEAYVAAGLPLAILSTGFFVNSLLNLGDGIIGAFDRTKRQLRNAVAAAGVSLGLNFALIPAYGISGAAVATAASLLLYGLLSFRSAYKLLGFHPFSAEFVKVVFAAVVSAALAFLVAGLDLLSGPAWPVLVGAFYLCAYAAIAFGLGAFGKEDFLIQQAVRGKLKRILGM